MPIVMHLKDHSILGPTYRKGIRKGLETARRIATRILVQRFGELPASATDRLHSMSSTQLEKLSARILTASTLDELFT